MGTRLTFWLPVLLAVCADRGLELFAGEPLDPMHGPGPVEVVQRVIDQGRGDDTTLVEVRVTNRGSQPALDVEVLGKEAPGYRLRAATATPIRDEDRMVWPLGTIQAGESRTLRLQWEPRPEAIDVPLRMQLRVTHRSSVHSELEAPARRVSIKLTAATPQTAMVGVPIRIRIDLLNLGMKTSDELVLQASFGAGLSHAMGKELENKLAAIPAGATRSVPLELIPTRSGDLRGLVRVRLPSGGVSEKEFVIHATEPTAALSISAPARCRTGEPVSVRFTVNNDGKQGNAQTRLVVRFPTSLQFLSASDEGSHVSDGCVYWDLGDLQPGQQRHVKLNVMTPRSGEQTITAVLSGEGREPISHTVVVQVQGTAAHDPPQGRRP